ncbi:LPXTG cell wall anchor domain-containing protein [Streptomyces sp. NPDC058326]|uniref:LPXTG cell wall anchor domain-containing protein n=1 Tax=Streptomyces sp. NPDC058326 TaxID=3346447 RepID=UPI0036EC882F
MRRTLISSGALVAAVAGSLVLAPLASASDGPKTYELPLHQPTPITAAKFQQGECPDTIPAGKDGWHFILPGGGVNFVELTVTFDNGAPITIKEFGPPKDDHAYVASEAGAELTSAVALVDGEVKQGFFNLSHTCAATETGGTNGGTTGDTTNGGATGNTTNGGTTGDTTNGGTTGDTTTGGTTGDTTTGGTTTGETTTGGATGGSTTGETTGATTTGGSATGGTTTGGSTTGDTTSGGSATGGSTSGETATGGAGDTDGDLAETGSSAPVGVLAAVALALAGAGAYLVTRRRKAAQQG